MPNPVHAKVLFEYEKLPEFVIYQGPCWWGKVDRTLLDGPRSITT